MRTIGIFTNIFRENAVSFSKKLITCLEKRNINYVCNEDISDFKKDIDFLCCIGGDGTFLKAAAVIKDKNIPIIGVNTGTVGFLMQIDQDEFDKAFDRLLKKDYRIENRLVICAELIKNNDEIEIFHALNEIFINRELSSRIVEISVKINDIKVENITGDGIMISTPTGSTAYSLSCGGSIISPLIQCLQIVPINSHSLHSRPLLVHHTDIIEIKIESKNGDICFVADGDQKSIIHNSAKIRIKTADFSIPFIVLSDNSFYKVLPKKIIFQSLEEEKD